MYRTKNTSFENGYIERYDSEYTSLVSRKCKCGHTVTIYNRYGREICKWCGRNVFLDKKHELYYIMKRKGVI